MKSRYLVYLGLMIAGIALLIIAGKYLITTANVCRSSSFINELNNNTQLVRCISNYEVSNITLCFKSSSYCTVYLIANPPKEVSSLKELLNYSIRHIYLRPRLSSCISINSFKGTYCILAKGNVSKYLLGTNIVVCSKRTIERFGSVTSITGVLLVLAGITLFLRELMKGRKEVPTELILNDVGKCITKSMNKHRCILYVPYGDEVKTFDEVIDVLTSKFNYRVWRKVADSIYVLKTRRGKDLRSFIRKPHMLIVSLIDNEVVLDYEISMWLASGPLDLKDVFNEFKEIVNEVNVKKNS